MALGAAQVLAPTGIVPNGNIYRKPLQQQNRSCFILGKEEAELETGPESHSMNQNLAIGFQKKWIA